MLYSYKSILTSAKKKNKNIEFNTYQAELKFIMEKIFWVKPTSQNHFIAPPAKAGENSAGENSAGENLKAGANLKNMQSELPPR